MIAVIGWDARMRNGVLAWEMLDVVDVWFAKPRNDVPAMPAHPKKRNQFTLDDIKKCKVVVHIEHDYLEHRLPDSREIFVATPTSTPPSGVEVLSLTAHIQKKLDERGIPSRMIRLGMQPPLGLRRSPARAVVRTIGHFGASGPGATRAGTDLVCQVHHILPHVPFMVVGSEPALFKHPWHPAAHAVCWSFENRWAAYATGQPDVALQPSRYESLPLTAIEASLLGIPVIGTDDPALDEVAPWKRLPAAKLDEHLREPPITTTASIIQKIYGQPLRDASEETLSTAQKIWCRERFLDELRSFLTC